MFGVLGTALGFGQSDEREAFLRRGIPLPDDLMTPAEKMHRFHRESYERMAREAHAQGYVVKGYRGSADGCGELVVERT